MNERVADLKRVRVWADALIVLHLDPHEWTFAFDNAKTRVGLCSYSRKRISISRYLAAHYHDDDVHQTLLHEVAHALAGPQAAHGGRWRAIAREIGYVGGRTHDGEIATDMAPWVGLCPSGHVHHRFRVPSRPLACSRCARHFDRAHLINWHRRPISASRPAALN